MLNRAFIITGLVQGVFFRDSTKKVALSLGLRGSAINLPNGTVKVSVYGANKDIDTLKKWLIEGPDLAKVESVTEVDIDEHLELNDFKVG